LNIKHLNFKFQILNIKRSTVYMIGNQKSINHHMYNYKNRK